MSAEFARDAFEVQRPRRVNDDLAVENVPDVCIHDFFLVILVRGPLKAGIVCVIRLHVQLAQVTLLAVNKFAAFVEVVKVVYDQLH
jgi:hypothetical protein